MKVGVLLTGIALTACTAPTDSEPSQQTSAVVDSGAASETPAQPDAAPANPVVTSNFGGGLRFRYTAIDRDGEVYVCGAYTGRGTQTSRKFSREAMRLGKVTIDGNEVLRNLRYFQEASSANWDNALVGVETSCRSTGLPAGSVDFTAVRVELREGRYRIYR